MKLQTECRTGSVCELLTLVLYGMSGPALPLYLLLWVLGATINSTQCQVVAAGPAGLTVEAGTTLELSCSVTMGAGNKVLQVRWLNNHDKLILAYQPGAKLHISHNEPNVHLGTSSSNASSITIKRLRGDGSGCYRCIFDIYPGGQQEGSTCVTVFGKVHLEGNRTAISGRPVTLSCWYSLPDRVVQVLWRKTEEQGDTATVASYTLNGPLTAEQFRGRVSLSHTLGNTWLTIRQVRMEDEACYTCEFHTYPDGSRSGGACLSVYVLPKPEVTLLTLSSGVTEVNCTAQSRPAAEVTWDIGSDNRTLGPPTLSVSDQGDGTTIVTSMLVFPSALLSSLSVSCVVHHPGFEKPVILPLHTKDAVRPAALILLLVFGVASVLLICLCVCLCRRFICIED